MILLPEPERQLGRAGAPLGLQARQRDPEQADPERWRKQRPQQVEADLLQRGPRSNRPGVRPAADDLLEVGILELHHHGAAGVLAAPAGLPHLGEHRRRRATTEGMAECTPKRRAS